MCLRQVPAISPEIVEVQEQPEALPSTSDCDGGLGCCPTHAVRSFVLLPAIYCSTLAIAHLADDRRKTAVS